MSLCGETLNYRVCSSDRFGHGIEFFLLQHKASSSGIVPFGADVSLDIRSRRLCGILGTREHLFYQKAQKKKFLCLYGRWLKKFNGWQAFLSLLTPISVSNSPSHSFRSLSGSSCDILLQSEKINFKSWIFDCKAFSFKGQSRNRSQRSSDNIGKSL